MTELKTTNVYYTHAMWQTLCHLLNIHYFIKSCEIGTMTISHMRYRMHKMLSNLLKS